MPNIAFGEFSGLNDSIFGKSIAPIKHIIGKRAEAFEKDSLLPILFSMDTSSNWAEKETETGSSESWSPVAENGEVPMIGMQEGYSKMLVYETWKDSFAVSREMIEDGKLMDMKKQPDKV